VNILSWIVVGLAAGAVARLVVRSDRSGCLFTIVVGIIGGVIGGSLFTAAGQRGIDEFSIWSIFVASIGAAVLLLVLDTLARRR
jgi:uncharacterized membrane protein YeaQ/YmgE (transglycosylase-associated protein family)